LSSSLLFEHREINYRHTELYTYTSEIYSAVSDLDIRWGKKWWILKTTKRGCNDIYPAPDITVIVYYYNILGDQISDDEMGGICSTHFENEKFVQNITRKYEMQRLFTRPRCT
jgi:hypothetical protein